MSPRQKKTIDKFRSLSQPIDAGDDSRCEPLTIDEIDAAIWILLDMRRRNPDVDFKNSMALLRMVRRMVWDVPGLSTQKLKVIYPHRFIVDVVRRMFGDSIDHHMRNVNIDREM